MKRALVPSVALKVLLGAVLLAVGLGGGTAQAQPPECLVPVELDVVIIIDRTGSMNQQVGDPPHTRLYWAKQAALALVNGIAGGPSSSSLAPHHVEVITFSGAGTVQRITDPLGSDDAEAVRSAIAGITASGDTYVAPALTLATADLNAHTHGGPYGSEKVVVLLSNGRNFDSSEYPPWPPDECPLTLQRRANTVNAIPALHGAADTVYTVGVGDEFGPPESCNDKELDEELLQDIAKGPPGDYTRVEDASDLPDIFNEIFYEIYICVSFGGHKYDDLDCDGPNGDSPLEGVAMVLLEEDGEGGWTENDRVPSGSEGEYIFVDKLPGRYLVCEDITQTPWTDREQTYPTGPGTGLLEHPDYDWCYDATLEEPGGSMGGLDFYNCVPPTPTPTPTATATPTPTNTPKAGVGGIVKLPPAAIAAESGAPAENSGRAGEAYAVLAGAMAAAVVAIVAGGRYARRRWLR